MYVDNSFTRGGRNSQYYLLPPLKRIIMEKRVLGIFLSILGIVGLIYAGVAFVNGSTGTRSVKTIAIAAVIGAIFFFAGISLVKNTKDKPT
jgi:uncharacterized membrane protein